MFKAKSGTFVHDHEITEEEEKRYADLFEKLDVDGDGRIDVDDLQEGLVRLGVSYGSKSCRSKPLNMSISNVILF